MVAYDLQIERVDGTNTRKLYHDRCDSRADKATLQGKFFCFIVSRSYCEGISACISGSYGKDIYAERFDRLITSPGILGLVTVDSDGSQFTQNSIS